MPNPYAELVDTIGIRKPVLRLTVGSGAEKYGTQASGTPTNSILASSTYNIVSDLVGLVGGAVIVDLNVADRRHQQVVVVVPDLVGLHEHLGVGSWLGGGALSGRWRPELVLERQEIGLRKRLPTIHHTEQRG